MGHFLIASIYVTRNIPYRTSTSFYTYILVNLACPLFTWKFSQNFLFLSLISPPIFSPSCPLTYKHRNGDRDTDTDQTHGRPTFLYTQSCIKTPISLSLTRLDSLLHSLSLTFSLIRSRCLSQVIPHLNSQLFQFNFP